jgi:hypothetical protein
MQRVNGLKLVRMVQIVSSRLMSNRRLEPVHPWQLSEEVRYIAVTPYVRKPGLRFHINPYAEQRRPDSLMMIDLIAVSAQGNETK